MPALNINIGDRWAVIGGTGSGKTWFDRVLLKTIVGQAAASGRLVPVYILDTKLQGDFSEFTRPDIGQVARGNDLPKLLSPKERRPFLVWQPEEDDLDLYDAFFKKIYQARRSCIVLIDELSSITNTNASRFPRYYDILLKQGRGMDIGLISNTQSPAYVPANLVRQATHLLRFRLNDEYDSKKLAKQLGRQYGDEWNPPDEFGFLYRNLSRPKLTNPTVYYKNMQEFFGL